MPSDDMAGAPWRACRYLIGIRNGSLAEKIGRLNVARFDRLKLSGSYVSAEQPSIIAGGEETFDNEIGAALLKAWNIPENYIARCFVTLGYCDGEYPQPKSRKAQRSQIIE